MNEEAIPSPTPVHYPDNRNPAQNPPGPIAPIPVSRDDGLRDYNDLFSLISAARRLWRISRHPRADPAFKEMRPQLEDWRDWMIAKSSALTEDHGNELVFLHHQLVLIENMLGETK